MKTLRNIIIFVVIAAVVGFGVYFFLIKKSPAVPTTGLQTTSVVDTTTPDGQVDATKVLSQQFVSSLAKIKNITLATTFFDSSVYKSLQDYTQSIVLQDQSLIGRANPFAPFDTDAVVPTVPNTVVNPTTSPDVITVPDTTVPAVTTPVTPVVKKTTKKK